MHKKREKQIKGEVALSSPAYKLHTRQSGQSSKPNVLGYVMATPDGLAPQCVLATFFHDQFFVYC